MRQPGRRPSGSPAPLKDWSVALLGIVALATSATAQQATFTGLGRSSARGVSDDGSIIVGRALPAGTPNPFGGYWTAADGWVSLGDQAFPNDISGDGRVIIDGGKRWTAADGWHSIGILPGGEGGLNGSWANALSYDGSVLVGASNSARTMPTNYEAFRWTSASGMVAMGGLGGNPILSEATAISAAGSVIVGLSNPTVRNHPDSGAFETFRWTAAGGMQGLGALPSATLFRSAASDVSPNGAVVVGWSQLAVNTTEAYRWTSETGMVGLGDLPGGQFLSGAVAVSADGGIIVGNGDGELGQEAFIWDARHGMRGLRDVLVSGYGLADELAGWTLREATDMSPDGRFIVGLGTSPTGVGEGWIVDLRAVPEPGGLIVLGLAATLIMRRRTARGQ